MTWSDATLADVATWGSGGTPQARLSAYYGGTIPWAVIGDLNDSVVRETKSLITEAGLANSSAKVVPAGTVLIAMYGSIGKLGIAGHSMATNQAIATAIPTGRVDPKFLFYYLLSQRNLLDAAGKGAAQRNISQSILKPWPIRFPSRLDEQRRIVDLLEDHLSRLDAAVRLLEESRRRSASLRQAAIDRAFWMVSDPSAERFRRQLISERGSPIGKQRKAVASPDIELLPDELPWPVASLEQLTDPLRTIRYGILKPKVDGGTVPYVEVKDLRDGPPDVVGLRLTSADLDAQYAAARLHPGDVVVAVRGSFERSAVVPTTLQGANISRDVVRLAPLPGISPWYLHYWHQTSTSKRYLRRHARGVAVRGVNVGSLRAMPVPVLTPDAQLAVVRAITEQEEAIDRLENEVQVAQSRASRLRRSLLAAAISGQLTGDLRE